MADPARHLPDSLGTLLNPVGSVGDKVNVGWYRLKSGKGTLDTVLTNPETTTLEALQVNCPDLEALLSVADGLLNAWPEGASAHHVAAWRGKTKTQLCTQHVSGNHAAPLSLKLPHRDAVQKSCRAAHSSPTSCCTLALALTSPSQELTSTLLCHSRQACP